MRNFFEIVRKSRLKKHEELVNALLLMKSRTDEEIDSLIRQLNKHLKDGDYTKELEFRYWELQEEYLALEQRMVSVVNKLRQENEDLKLKLKEVMNNS